MNITMFRLFKNEIINSFKTTHKPVKKASQSFVNKCMVCDYAPATFNKQFKLVDKDTTIVTCLPIHKTQNKTQSVCMECWSAKMLYYVKHYNVAHRGRDLVIKTKK